MNIGLTDIADLLQLPEKTILRWVKEQKIPAYRIGNEYRFNKSEINDWVLQNRMHVSERVLDLHTSGVPAALSALVERGGIVRDVPGDSVPDVLRAVVPRMPLPEGLAVDEVAEALLARETLMPTALGKGLAIPHPRNPLLAELDRESVTICLPEKPVDYGAPDGEAVHTLFIVLSANPKRHLEILSLVSFLCQQEAFLDMLRTRAPDDALRAFIAEQEGTWVKNRAAHG